MNGAFYRQWIGHGATYLGHWEAKHMGGGHAVEQGTHHHDAAEVLYLVKDHLGVGQSLVALRAEALYSAQHCIQLLLHSLCGRLGVSPGRALQPSLPTMTHCPDPLKAPTSTHSIQPPQSHSSRSSLSQSL